MTDSIKVDVWSDVVCPWCYIGKRKFEEGARRAGVPVEIEYHSFELSPGTPLDSGVSEVDLLVEHKGLPEAQVRQMLDQVTAVAAGVGLDFHFESTQATGTLPAHELLHFAKAHGRQLELKERLLRAHFVEGGHVGRLDDLVGYAAEVGLDADAARAALVQHTYLDDVQTDIAQAAAYGIQGVPFFVIDGRYGISGAQDPDTFAEALRQVAAEQPAADTAVVR
ncbi:DsbA family protein [uncultured Amnibacterium sp.]|uniref:DsbA family oxidoreductase n=1 Tax=uncultured Amnibacterium sp. TaxID=1631851 RepID=UPI0035CAF0BC